MFYILYRVCFFTNWSIFTRCVKWSIPTSTKPMSCCLRQRSITCSPGSQKKTGSLYYTTKLKYLYYRTNKKHSSFVLYNIQIIFCHLQCVISLYILENTISGLIVLFQVKGHRSAPLHTELYHCTVLLYDDITCVQWSIFYIK